jgi:hypothetical protein
LAESSILRAAEEVLGTELDHTKRLSDNTISQILPYQAAGITMHGLITPGIFNDTALVVADDHIRTVAARKLISGDTD